jgi:mannose-6-phosphate isomerase-like protein (cupin superfamily)
METKEAHVDEAFYCAAGEASFKLGDEELSVAALL